LKKLAALLLLPLFACGGADTAGNAATETADEFVARINAELADLNVESGAAGWVRATYITHDTAILSSLARQRYAPNDAAKREELARITTELAGMYGAGKYCPGDGRECMELGQLEDVLAKSRDYDESLDAWVGWRSISPPMREQYRRFAELANEGANELGYADLGEMWRAEYDMSPVEFESEALRLYRQVEPLYNELHCYVRTSLARHYGEDKVPLDAPIPAHLLGNMWSQTWDNIYDLLEPYPGVGDVNVDATLARENYSPKQMVQSAEGFYVSLGFDPLPETFWERSMFTKPADRDVICHASAWGLDGGNDLRIKMCIKQTYEELRVIYHELPVRRRDDLPAPTGRCPESLHQLHHDMWG
jgi:peptidyl-dipeptidase A